MTSPLDASLVSVCVPTYNGERFLQEALDSASTQTLRNIEILVVDDGSTDGTVARVEAHAARDPRVRLLRNERNLGLVGNWNRCLEVARGEWIKFLFQDDLLDPTCVARMVAAGSDERPFVVCGRRVIEGEGADEGVARYLREKPTLLGATDAADLSPDEFSRLHGRDLHENLIGEPPCVMLRRDVSERIGEFDPAFRQLCDLEYWLRAGANFGVALVREDLAAFRAHGSSTTAGNRTRRVNVTDVDKVLLTRKVQSDPRFARLRAALPPAETRRKLVSVLSSLVREQAETHDATFAEALRTDGGLARTYGIVRRVRVPLLDGARRILRRTAG